jgi:hypothetical protein
MEQNEKTKANAWDRPLKGWQWVAAWVCLVLSLATLARIVIGLTTDRSSIALPWLLSVGIALAIAILIGFSIWSFSSWLNFKRFLFSVACFAGVIALFYAEEDIRGRMAWGGFKTRWEATILIFALQKLLVLQKEK